MSGSEGVWVWVVNDPQQHVAGTSLNGAGSAIHDMLVRGVTDESIAASEGMFSLWMQDKTLGRYEWKGYTLQRLPLATPAMVAVMEAAIAYRRCTLHEIGDDYGCEQDDAYDALLAAIDAARAAGGA